MMDSRVLHLPVVEKVRLIGIISIGDLMKSIIDDGKFDISQHVDYLRG
jgi:CBS domain-containing protein